MDTVSELDPTTLQSVAMRASLSRNALDMIKSMSHPLIYMAAADHGDMDEWDDLLTDQIRAAARNANTLLDVVETVNRIVNKPSPFRLEISL